MIRARQRQAEALWEANRMSTTAIQRHQPLQHRVHDYRHFCHQGHRLEWRKREEERQIPTDQNKAYQPFYTWGVHPQPWVCTQIYRPSNCMQDIHMGTWYASCPQCPGYICQQCGWIPHNAYNLNVQGGNAIQLRDHTDSTYNSIRNTTDHQYRVIEWRTKNGHYGEEAQEKFKLEYNAWKLLEDNDSELAASDANTSQRQ